MDENLETGGSDGRGVFIPERSTELLGIGMCDAMLHDFSMKYLIL